MVITYVTITYNAADVLKRTLDSVLQQDYRDIVHLIIDGASTDGTLQIVDDYIRRSNAADNGHRIQITSEPLYLTMGTVPFVRNQLCFMEIRTSSTLKATFFIIVVSLPQSTSPGNPSATACSSVIRPSTHVPTSPSPRLTTSATVTLPMSTGASAS